MELFALNKWVIPIFSNFSQTVNKKISSKLLQLGKCFQVCYIYMYLLLCKLYTLYITEHLPIAKLHARNFDLLTELSATLLVLEVCYIKQTSRKLWLIVSVSDPALMVKL